MTLRSEIAMIEEAARRVAIDDKVCDDQLVECCVSWKPIF